MWGVTVKLIDKLKQYTISIHTPRVGSDKRARPNRHGARDISIHTPRVGSDPPPKITSLLLKLFQSTLPVWGVTRPPGWMASALLISIHTPRVGSDCRCQAPCDGAHLFQSTLPVWGVTLKYRAEMEAASISIHTPRVGSDPHPLPSGAEDRDFNPHSPCGE